MSNEDKIQVEGLVVEALPGTNSGYGSITGMRSWHTWQERCASITSASCWAIVSRWKCPLMT